MLHLERVRTSLALGAVISVCFLAGCTTQGAGGLTDGVKTSSIGKISSGKTSYAYSAKDKECLARAMFFESNRSSREGLVAVGTVVMNRLDSGLYGNTVCGVVGQKGQFAPGVLSRKMNSSALPDVMAAADAVLKGERHPAVKQAMFFHTAGLRFPYKNMHYVLQAGGNAFYEKRSRHRMQQFEPETQLARSEQQQQNAASATTQVAADVTPTPAAAPRMAYAAQPRIASAASQFRDGAGTRAKPTAVAAPQPVQTAVAEETTVALPDGRVPVPQSRMPSATRFGHDAGFQQVATVEDATPAAALSFEADQKSADAIGALIASQIRP